MSGEDVLRLQLTHNTPSCKTKEPEDLTHAGSQWWWRLMSVRSMTLTLDQSHTAGFILSSQAQWHSHRSCPINNQADQPIQGLQGSHLLALLIHSLPFFFPQNSQECEGYRETRLFSSTSVFLNVLTFLLFFAFISFFCFFKFVLSLSYCTHYLYDKLELGGLYTQCKRCFIHCIHGCVVYFFSVMLKILMKRIWNVENRQRERAGRVWSVSELYRHRRGSVCAQYVREWCATHWCFQTTRSRCGRGTISSPRRLSFSVTSCTSEERETVACGGARSQGKGTL